MYSQITDRQRYSIQAHIKDGRTAREISELVGKHISTIYREIGRNGNPKSYNAEEAERKARRRKEHLHRPRTFTPERKREFEALVRERGLSPEQILGYKKKCGEGWVSVETMYAYVRLDRKAGGDLYLHMRHKLKKRSRGLYNYKTPIPDRVDISERPAEADGSRIGDFEMDLIQGPGGKFMLTLFDRNSNFGLIRKLKHGKNASEVAKTVVFALLPYKSILKTITTDNGPEFAEHGYITRKLGVKVYFARPYHSWEKGGVENYNKLVRQYIPKRANFDDFSEQQVAAIQKKINERPRKKLGFDCPKNVFFSGFS